jgi:hypothetical protein
MMASSTASAVAVNRALIRRFETIETVAVSGAADAPAFAWKGRWDEPDR